DIARPVKLRMTKCKLKEIEGVELFPHPSHNPDLAPLVYRMSRSMKPCFRGRRFLNTDDLEKGV
ncbi:hypothetical protein AVEN_133889-1, partial [Araneus ventricosus]